MISFARAPLWRSTALAASLRATLAAGLALAMGLPAPAAEGKAKPAPAGHAAKHTIMKVPLPRPPRARRLPMTTPP